MAEGEPIERFFTTANERYWENLGEWETRSKRHGRLCWTAIEAVRDGTTVLQAGTALL